jgi:hypothetical protein
MRPLQVLVFTALCALSLSAAPITAIGVTGGTDDQFVGSAVVGYIFHTNSAISVTDLGVYSIGGFVAPESVGLWNSSGTLLASSAVSGSDAIGQFVFEPITPVTLDAGQDYTIGQLLLVAGSDFQHVLIFPTGFTTAPEITYVAGASISSGSLVKPGSGVITPFVGPNFQFTTATGVPEPASFLLFGVGIVAVRLARRVSAA